MITFWWNVLAAATGQAIAFVLYQGFVNSYWGKNSREEISRFFDRFCKHVQKGKI